MFIDELVEIHQFSKTLGSFLRAWEVDFVTNLQSYLRRKDYTFSKELFGCITVRKKFVVRKPFRKSCEPSKRQGYLVLKRET